MMRATGGLFEKMEMMRFRDQRLSNRMQCG